MPVRSEGDRLVALELVDTATLQLELGNIEQADAAYRMAFERYPLAAALDGIGCVALYVGDLKKAHQFFSLAYEADTDYHSALGHRAMAYELEGNRAEADRLYQQALLLEPTDGRIRNNYAAFLFDGGLSPRAITEVRDQLLQVHSVMDHDLVTANFNKVDRLHESQEGSSRIKH
jgi:tetratricopeptide (TPR) repeat protein